MGFWLIWCDFLMGFRVISWCFVSFYDFFQGFFLPPLVGTPLDLAGVRLAQVENSDVVSRNRWRWSKVQISRPHKIYDIQIYISDMVYGIISLSNQGIDSGTSRIAGYVQMWYTHWNQQFAPENWWLEGSFTFGMAYFQGRLLLLLVLGKVITLYSWESKGPHPPNATFPPKKFSRVLWKGIIDHHDPLIIPYYRALSPTWVALGWHWAGALRFPCGPC